VINDAVLNDNLLEKGIVSVLIISFLCSFYDFGRSVADTKITGLACVSKQLTES
jgi:hypothetical protein